MLLSDPQTPYLQLSGPAGAEGQVVVVDVQGDAAGVADGLAAPVLVGNRDGEVLSPRGWCMAGCTQQVLTGTLEVEAVPVQGDVMGVTPGLTFGRTNRTAAVLARGQQGTHFTEPTPGRLADQRATPRSAVAPLGAGGTSPELTACLVVSVVGPAAAAPVQRNAAVYAQHKARVALAALSAGALTWGWDRGGRRGRAAGRAWWATELIVAVVGAGDLCRWIKEGGGERERMVLEGGI